MSPRPGKNNTSLGAKSYYNDVTQWELDNLISPNNEEQGQEEEQQSEFSQILYSLQAMSTELQVTS